jgi:hypothetical protein
VRYAEKRIGEPLSIRPEQLIPRMEKTPIDAPLAGAKAGSTRFSKKRVDPVSLFHGA